MWTCKYCNVEFDFVSASHKANHSRWCSANPKRSLYISHNISRASEMADARHGQKIDIGVVCDTCGNEFTVVSREKAFDIEKKRFCSRSCANSVGGQAKKAKYNHTGIACYRDIAIRHHGDQCIVCGFDKVVDVHHIDGDRSNAAIGNLVPLCPNHHAMIHRSKYRQGIIDIITKKLYDRTLTTADDN